MRFDVDFGVGGCLTLSEQSPAPKTKYLCKDVIVYSCGQANKLLATLLTPSALKQVKGFS